MKKVYIVDDHPVMRNGIAQLISQEKDFDICGQSGNYSKALEDIKTMKPDIALIDISIEGGNGIDLIKDIKISLPELPILIFSMHEEKFYAQRALNAGAKGFIMKQEPADAIVEAMKTILNGRIYLSKDMKERMLDKMMGHKADDLKPTPEVLSDREMEIFRLIGEGFKPGEIASKINLSVKTVDSYRERIKTKLNIETSAELTRQAIQWHVDFD